MTMGKVDKIYPDGIVDVYFFHLRWQNYFCNAESGLQPLANFKQYANILLI